MNPQLDSQHSPPALQPRPISDYLMANLRALRIEKRLRIEDMTKRTGIPMGSYSCLETGRYRVSVENLFRILQALGVSIEDVWPGARPDGPAHRVDDRYVRNLLRLEESLLPRRLTLEEILEAVCAGLQVTLEELSSPSRRRSLAQARTAAAVLVYEAPHLSLSALGKALNRNVSSLSHCLNRWRKSPSQELAARLDGLRQRLDESGGESSPAD